MAFDLGAFMRTGGAGIASYLNATTEREEREKQAEIDERERAEGRRMDLLRRRLIEQQLADRQQPEGPEFRVTADGMSGVFGTPEEAAAFRDRWSVPDAPASPRAPVTRNSRDGMIQFNPDTGEWEPLTMGGNRVMSGSPPRPEDQAGGGGDRSAALVTDALMQARELGTTSQPTRELFGVGLPLTGQEVGSAAEGSNNAFDRPDLDEFSFGGQQALLDLVEKNNVRRELRVRYPDASPDELEAMLERMLAEMRGGG